MKLLEIAMFVIPSMFLNNVLGLEPVRNMSGSRNRLFGPFKTTASISNLRVDERYWNSFMKMSVLANINASLTSF